MTTFNDGAITEKQLDFIRTLLRTKEVPEYLMMSLDEIPALTKREAWEYTQELIDLPKKVAPRNYAPRWEYEYDDVNFPMDYSDRLDMM